MRSSPETTLNVSSAVTPSLTVTLRADALATVYVARTTSAAPGAVPNVSSPVVVSRPTCVGLGAVS